MGFSTSVVTPPFGPELGDAELRRVVDLGEQDLRVVRAGTELVDELGDAADDEVVAEVHDEVVVAEEVLRDEHAVGQAQRGLLLDVGHADAELGAVADGRLDLGRGVADDDADVGDARVADRLEAVEQHRLVGHRHQLLGGGVRDGPQPRACTTGQDQCLHGARG